MSTVSTVSIVSTTGSGSKKVRVAKDTAMVSKGSKGSKVSKVSKTNVAKPDSGKKKKAASSFETSVNEVVQMVNEMKGAFDDEPIDATAPAVPDADVVPLDSELSVELTAELTALFDTALSVTVTDGDDGRASSSINFDEMRLAGEETPRASPAYSAKPASSAKSKSAKTPKKKKETAVPAVPTAPTAPAVHAVHAAVHAQARSTFRHEFSNECFQLLQQFTRESLTLDRKAFKVEWERFTTEHAEFISQETARLVDAGYTGDVVDKMFKTSRYYLTKREREKRSLTALSPKTQDDASSVSEHAASSVEEKKRRRPYTTLNKAILESMDAHISAMTTGSQKPAACYAEFYNRFRDQIECEIARLIRTEAVAVVGNSEGFSQKSAEEKLKKTYKNRMFTHSHPKCQQLA